MEKRIEKLYTSLSECSRKNNTAAVIADPKNRFYFSGVYSSLGFMFVTKEYSYLLVDFRYAEAAREKCRVCEVVEFSDLCKSLKRLALKHNISQILLENEGITLARANMIEMFFSEMGISCIKDNSLDKITRNFRMIKTDYEVEKIKKAQELTELAFNNVLKKIKVGTTEKEIALDIEFFMRKNGAQSIAFDLIVVSGENTSFPHGVPTDKRIQKGDLITMDIGASLDGYASDMTRTAAVGSVSDGQKDIYDLVLHAQSCGINAIKPGIRCNDIDKIVRDIIYDAGFEGCFGHSTGHSLGLDVHEYPRFSSECKQVLLPGMVMTVEPGIYIPKKFGVRIEDMVYVKNNGCENLTFIPKELILL